MNGTLFVGVKGGTATFVDANGVVTRTLPLAPGRWHTASIEKFRLPGETVEYDTPVQRVLGNTERISHHGAWDSSANPSFRVSPAQKQARELALLMQRTRVMTQRANRALSEAKRMAAVPALAHHPELGGNGAGEVPAS